MQKSQELVRSKTWQQTVNFLDPLSLLCFASLHPNLDVPRLDVKRQFGAECAMKVALNILRHLARRPQRSQRNNRLMMKPVAMSSGRNSLSVGGRECLARAQVECPRRHAWAWH